jgi:hypothetical protein
VLHQRVTENVNPDEFQSILEQNRDEHKVAKYLRKHPWLLYWNFCRSSGHDRYAFAEFPLGSQFKVDSLLLNSYSGVWRAHLVELEPVADLLFTKSRTPSQRLARAVRQIDDWREYIDQNREQIRRDLVRWAKRHDRLGYSTGEEPCNYSGDFLSDPETHIHFTFYVVIGRSSRLSKERRNLAGRFVSGHDVELVTYDRLLALAKRRYGSSTSGE